MPTNNPLAISDEVSNAITGNRALVALESAVITHGLPFPQNEELALDLEQVVRDAGAIPATVAVIAGKIRVGLTPQDIQYLANHPSPRKISRRDFGIAIARKESGGTTVAGTLFAAQKAGIQVFATGGIGGVHRNAPFDVSADLQQLSCTPVVVVCAGAKAILDLPATLEVLETFGVPVIGYRTSEFPAFYSRSSGIPINLQCQTPEEIASIARAQWKASIESAVLVVNPLPEEAAIPLESIETWIHQAVNEAEQKEIHGSAVTPYLLQRVNELSNGRSLQANLALLRQNARLAAKIALAFAENANLLTV